MDTILMRNVSVRSCTADEPGAADPLAPLDETPRPSRPLEQPSRWVAENGSRILGEVCLLRDTAWSAQVFGLTIWSRDDHDAVTAVLLNAVIMHCRKQACVRIVLAAGVNRRIAASVFASHGFQCNRRPGERGELAFYVNLRRAPERRTCVARS